MVLDRGQNGNGRIAGDHAVGTPGASWDDRLGRQLPFLDVTVSVVIPTLDEERNLPHVLPQIPPWVDEVVLVDGGSEDGTLEVAQSLLPTIRVVHEHRPGKGVALQTGFSAARGDIIVTLDADGSTDPAEIPAFVGCLLGGADFAKGSRFVQGGGTSDMERIRRAGNWGLKRLVRIAFGGHYSDLCYGYNAFWRHVLPVIDGEAAGFEIETLMNVRVLAAGMRVTEVASHEARRIHGQSHLKTFRDGFRVLRTIIREWWRSPRRARARGWDRHSSRDHRTSLLGAAIAASSNGHHDDGEVADAGLTPALSTNGNSPLSTNGNSPLSTNGNSPLSTNGNHDHEEVADAG